jgi:hypothetical protein
MHVPMCVAKITRTLTLGMMFAFGGIFGPYSDALFRR